MTVSATAEPAPEAAAPAAQVQRAPRVKRELTVELDTVKAGDEFEGVVVSSHGVGVFLSMHPHLPQSTTHCLPQSAIEGYGAFVNFGAKQDGLVHISQLSVSAKRDHAGPMQWRRPRGQHWKSSHRMHALTRLIHAPCMQNKRVASVAEAVKVGDAVKVRVLSVDAAAGKIALSMKEGERTRPWMGPPSSHQQSAAQPERQGR
jgi:predicted RNA-binding protein with RPS1 domain